MGRHIDPGSDRSERKAPVPKYVGNRDTDSDASRSGRGGPRRARVARTLTGVALVGILAGGAVVWWTQASGACSGDRVAVNVATDATMSGTLTSMAGELSAESCYRFTVTEVAGPDLPAVLAGGRDVPDLWVADSQIKARRIASQLHRDPSIIVDSIASSPAVVVGKKPGGFASWLEVLERPNLKLGNPVSTSTVDAPVVAAASEAQSGVTKQKDLGTTLATVGLAQNNSARPDDSQQALIKLADTSTSVVVTTEQQYQLYLRENSDSKVTSVIPRSGTVMLDYPVVMTAPDDRRDITGEAVKVLADFVVSDRGRSLLYADGFRDSDGGGDGEEVRLLKVAGEDKTDRLLKQWQALILPPRSQVLIDASGSMSTQAGPSTRADLTVQSVIDAFKLIPDNGVMGTWIFGIDKGGLGTDWKEVTPPRRMDEFVGSKTQREVLASEITRAMSTQLGGGTGLYDSILAGYKDSLANYDPESSNNLLIVTDGRNEDSKSIGLDQLLVELRKLQDVTRPIDVFLIGITEDADKATLTKIADEIGGTAYVATDPTSIRTVFLDSRLKSLGEAGA